MTNRASEDQDQLVIVKSAKLQLQQSHPGILAKLHFESAEEKLRESNKVKLLRLPEVQLKAPEGDL